MQGTIAYIMSRFPHLPETFILREMVELEQQGWAVALYPLIVQKQPVVHAEARPWIERAEHLPFVSRDVLVENGRTLLRAPGPYALTWGRSLWENRTSPNFLARAIALLPKAVYAARRMQAQGVVHIHAHYATHPALVAWIIHRLTGISYSITAHAHDIYVRTAMLGAKLRDAAFVVAISEYNREYLARLVGPWVREKTHVIHCGVNPSDYAPRVAPAAAGTRFEILCVGSLQPYKGHRYLIQACEQLRERGIPFHCRIIGGGEERSRLEQLIATAGLDSSIELLGPLPQDQVAQILPTAHCYVQPSIITRSGKTEGLPVALMEALACSVPVVATSVSGVPELVYDGETGYLAPPENVQALADRLSVVYTNPLRSFQMAQAGREMVLNQFDLSANTHRLSTLFGEVVERSKVVDPGCSQMQAHIA